MSLKGDKTILLSRGSDIRFQLEYTDAAGDPVDMTGHTIAIFEADEGVAS